MNFEDLNLDNIQSNELDFEKIYQDVYVDLSEEIQPPEILLSIGEHLYKNKYYPTAVMTSGECSVITAESKKKKSYLKSAFVASYIGAGYNQYFDNIRCHREKDFTLLDFDTEQGKYYAQRTFRRPSEMTGANYNHYYSYTLRSKTAKERLFFIDECIKRQETLYKEPIKLIFIDGIADLIDNTNDIEASKTASDYVMRWTSDYNLHVNTIIHKVQGTGKPTGHLGSFLLKKAETVFDLSQGEDKNILVTNSYSRGYHFDDFEFNVNSDGLPYKI